MISEEEKLIATLATQIYTNRITEGTSYIRNIEFAVVTAIDIIKETKKSTRPIRKEREPVEDDNPYRAVFDE